MSPEWYEAKQLAYKSYLEERKGLNEAELAACENYDKYMITLSSGALGLSVLYLEKIAKQPLPYTYPWLYTAWGAFGVALCIMLASFLLSQSSWRRRRDLLDEGFTRDWGQMQPASKPEDLSLVDTDYCGLVTNWMNRLALLLFAVGILTFLVFSIRNLPRFPQESTMAGPDKKQGNGYEKKGAPGRPPAVPAPKPVTQPPPASTPPPSKPGGN